MTHSYNYYYF